MAGYGAHDHHEPRRQPLMGADAWLTLAVIIATLVVLATDRLPPSQVILGATVVLFLLGVTDAGEAFQGFSNRAPITVAALYVVAGAVERTGALHAVTGRILPSAHRTGGPPGRRSPRVSRRELARFLPASLAPSALLNNTAIVAMLAPRVMAWSRRTGRSPAGFLIPLSYASILGGLLTAIGTSTNLIVSGLLTADGQEPLGMFEITRVGLPLAVVGVALLVVVGPYFLPAGRPSARRPANAVREFTVEMAVADRGGLAGTTVEGAGLRRLEGVYLVEIIRAGRSLAPVAPFEVLAAGDRLVFAGNLDRIVDLQHMTGLVAAEAKHYGDARERRFHEMVVSPMSSLVGSTLKAADFRNRYGAAVVAIHRAGQRVPSRLGDVRLHAGDVLLVLADEGLPRRLRDHHDFLVVSTVAADTPPRREHARVVEGTILVLLVVVGLGWLDILRGVLLAAAVLLVTRAVSPAEARRSMDLDVLVMIAASFGMGAAVATSGLAGTLATGIADVLGRYGEIGLVAGVLLCTVLLTEIVTNNAAAVLMFPVGMAAAASAGLDPRVFAITIAVGASASFLTPIGYQTNTMVYGMGGYRFTDFTRAGIPLTLAVLVLTPPIVLLAW